MSLNGQKSGFSGPLKSKKLREHARYFLFFRREGANRGLAGGAQSFRTLRRLRGISILHPIAAKGRARRLAVGRESSKYCVAPGEEPATRKARFRKAIRRL